MLGDLFDRGMGFTFLLVATKIFGLEIYGAYLIALGVLLLAGLMVAGRVGSGIAAERFVSQTSSGRTSVPGRAPRGGRRFLKCMSAVFLRRPRGVNASA